MATFDYTHMVFFVGRGDGAQYEQVQNNPGTLRDLEDDSTFEAGDFNFSPWGPQTYIGTTIIDGQQWPAFTTSSNHTIVYMNQAPVELPTTLQVDEGATFCFAVGTLIATPKGETAVEALAVGDLVLTQDGRAVPVKWLGRQTLAPRFQRLRLIRMAAGALGGGLPARDLVLTADHALMLDGLLINAGALVNGTTITEVADLPERVTVYHIETEDHDIILAEGTPAETYVDYAGRQAFDNYAEYLALYGAERIIAENPAPRITSARHLPADLKARLRIGRAA